MSTYAQSCVPVHPLYCLGSSCSWISRSAGRGPQDLWPVGGNCRENSRVTDGVGWTRPSGLVSRRRGDRGGRGVRRSLMTMEDDSSLLRKSWGFIKSMLNIGRTTPPVEVEVAVIGAGIAGLVCARILTRAGLVVKVFEASDGVGGRVRTDEVDGFLLDRGFQVFIESYPEVKRQLNNKKLNLRRFDPGAIVRCDGGFHLVSDPLRKPELVLEALRAPVGSLMDKIRVGLQRVAVVFREEEEIFSAPEESTLDFLQGTLGLSSSIVSRFFAPFYQGIFLSPLEEQSSRMFEFVFKMFAVGYASLPEGGMGQVPDQIAAELPEGCVSLNTPVVSLTRLDNEDVDARGESPDASQEGVGRGGDGRSLASRRYGNGDDSPRVRLGLGGGGEVLAHTTVVATEAPAAAALLGGKVLEGGARPSGGRSSTCLYFALDGPAPVDGSILLLNGEGTSPDRPVNNVVFLEKTAPSYAPKGKSLASVTVVGDPACTDDELERRVRAHLSEWFDASAGAGVGDGDSSMDSTAGKGRGGVKVAKEGVAVAHWRHLRTYRVPYAQPAQMPPVGEGGFYGRSVELDDGIFVCGDHRATPTLDGAMRSGVLAAEAVVRSLLTGNACSSNGPQRSSQNRVTV